MEHPEKSTGVAARNTIAHLQQSVLALMDRDQVLPADSASLLAALDRKLSEPGGESATAARAGIEAFIGWMQALVEAGVIEAADGHARIEAAAALGALFPSADGTDPETRTRRGDT